MVKYLLWVQKSFREGKIQHEGCRHIDFRQISVSPGQTTANNCKTTCSLHVTSSYFWGRKINLRYTWTFQRVTTFRNFGRVRPVSGKMGAGTSPIEPEFFCVVIQKTFRQLRNGRLSPKLVTKHSLVSRRKKNYSIKTFSNIFTLGSFFPKI